MRQHFIIEPNDNIYFYGNEIEKSRKQGDTIISYFDDSSLKSYDDGTKKIEYYTQKDKNLYSVKENGITTFYYRNNLLYSTSNNITGFGSSSSETELYSFSINDGGNDVCIFHK